MSRARVPSMAMRFGAAFWINRTTWTDLREAGLAVERRGWDSLWIDDHLLADEGDPSDGKLEGWTTLAALAVLTTRGPPRPPGRGQHLPQPGPHGEARDDAGPPVGRSRRPGDRWWLVRA